jgi:hypothetical protein
MAPQPQSWQASSSVAKGPDDAFPESSLLLVSDPIVAGVQQEVALTTGV